MKIFIIACLCGYRSIFYLHNYTICNLWLMSITSLYLHDIDDQSVKNRDLKYECWMSWMRYLFGYENERLLRKIYLREESFTNKKFRYFQIPDKYNELWPQFLQRMYFGCLSRVKWLAMSTMSTGSSSSCFWSNKKFCCGANDRFFSGARTESSGPKRNTNHKRHSFIPFTKKTVLYSI